MPPYPTDAENQREHPRIHLPAMYTLVRARVAGSSKYTWTGHLYDLSVTGMRFELDMPIATGTEIEVRVMLPGKDHTSFRATGKVVRLHSDAEDLGPAIMGLHFDHFRSPMDYHRLLAYIEARGAYRETTQTHKRAA